MTIVAPPTYHERLLKVAQALEDLKKEEPNVICPSPAQLLALEDLGYSWDFETGKPLLTPDKWEHLKDWPSYTPPTADDGDGDTVKIPIVGTIGKDGIKLYAKK